MNCSILGSSVHGIFQARVLEWLPLPSSTSMWDESNCAVDWAFFCILALWDWNEYWPFPVLWSLLNFRNCWHIECSTFTASSVRIEIAQLEFHHLLTFFVVMLPKAQLTLHPRMSGSRWVITTSWLSWFWRSFLQIFHVFLPPLFSIFCFC